MAFGWDSEVLEAEQKLANLFYTVENTIDTLQKAWRVGNKLKFSEVHGLQFNWTHGYRYILCLGVGYWTVYSNRIGSMGDARHSFTVWDDHLAWQDAMPRGLVTRKLPYDLFEDGLPTTEEGRTAQALDSFQTSFNQAHAEKAMGLLGIPWAGGIDNTEDHLIAATILRNKRKFLPMAMPPELGQFFRE